MAKSVAKEPVVAWHPWSTDVQAVEIMKAVIAAEEVNTIMETGTCVGATAYEFAKMGLDVFTCDVEDYRDQAVRMQPNIHFTHGDVDTLISELPAGVKIDAAYVDGDHSYDGCAKDFKAAEKMNARIIFVHDCYGIESVRRFIVAQRVNAHYDTILFQTYGVTPDGVRYMNGLAVLKRR